MPMLRAIRLLSSISAGTTSGGQLETLLAVPGRLSDLNQVLTLQSQCQLLAASSTAMAAVAASSTAMAAVAASSTAMAAVAASSTAMAAVIASSTAMAALRASGLALSAISGTPAAGVWISVSKAPSSTMNIQVTPGPTGRVVIVGAKLENTGAGALTLEGFLGGPSGLSWGGTSEVQLAASAVVPNTAGGSPKLMSSTSPSRVITIYYIPV